MNLQQLDRDGFTFQPTAFSAQEIDELRSQSSAALRTASEAESVIATTGGNANAAQSLLTIWPDIIDIVRNSVISITVREILGSYAGIVRGLYFDKPPGESWALPWHRDLTIAVKYHPAAGPWKHPRIKGGIPHVEAPAELLAQMVTIRIHLDEVSKENGPMLVAPGSHLVGDKDEMADRQSIPLYCQAGDVLFMRPLLMHASGHCEESHRGNRRVIHLECAKERALPFGYEWRWFYPFAPNANGAD